MKRRYFSLFIAISVAISIVSACKEKNVLGGDTFYWYSPQECDYLHLFNFTRNAGHSSFVTISGVGLGGDEIASSDYCLALMLSSFDVHSPHMYDSEDSKSLHDTAIEEELKTFVKGKWKQLTKSDLIPISYRDKTVKSIHIMADKDVSGIKAGDSLNALFEIYGGPEYHDYLIDSSKKLLGKLRWGWSIDEYLSHKPLASPMLFLHLKNSLPETPVSITFNVEVQLEDRTLDASVAVSLI